MFLKYWLKFIYNYITSSNYVVKGKCKACGACCRNILLSNEKGYIKTLEDFKKLQKISKNVNNFEVAGELTEKDKLLALLFKCKFLKENGKCAIYFFRPVFCRDYPAINPDFIQRGGETLDECGFYFDVNKKFTQYLN